MGKYTKCLQATRKCSYKGLKKLPAGSIEILPAGNAESLPAGTVVKLSRNGQGNFSLQALDSDISYSGQVHFSE